MVKKYSELCMETRRAILELDGEQSGGIARELVAFAADKTMEELARDMQLYAPDQVIVGLQKVVEAYLHNKPLAYILGQWSFFGLPMKVTEDVLIPRDDSMVVTALALEELKNHEKPRVLDICTGSGCIGIAIAHNNQNARVTLADISDAALKVAKENVTLNRLTGRVSTIKVDCREAAPSFLGKFDLIVSNPPYITASDMRTLQPSVMNYEPHLALYGGEDGLDFYRCICANYYDSLYEGGCICLEFGIGQEQAVGNILRENNFEDLLFCRDTSDIIRAVIARKKGKE